MAIFKLFFQILLWPNGTLNSLKENLSHHNFVPQLAQNLDVPSCFAPQLVQNL